MTTIATSPAPAFSASAFAPQSGPRPGQPGELLHLARIIGDETGKYSDQDKIKADFRLSEIRSTNLFDYSLEERREYGRLYDNSSYLKRVRVAEEKWGRIWEQYSGGGGSDVAALKARIIAYDTQLTDFEKSLPDYAGLRERMVVLLGMQEQLQARADAGAFKYGTPPGQVDDPEAQLILQLFNKQGLVQRTSDGQLVMPKEFAPYLQRGYELLGEGGFGTIQDTISLSPQARRAMGA